MRKPLKTLLQILLLLFLTAAVFIFMLWVMGLWIISRFPPEQVIDLMNGAERSRNLELWMRQGLGMPGLRYLFFEILKSPVVLAVLLILFLFLFLTGWKTWQFAGCVCHEDQKLSECLVNEEMTEREMKSFHVLLSGKRVYSLLDGQKRKISWKNRELEENKHDYENVLHQVRAKLTSLYFAVDELPEEVLKENPDLEEILDESNELVRNALKDSVYRHCSLKTITETVVRQMAKEFEALKVGTLCSLEEAWLIADESWVRQVVETIVSNAAGFTEEGGIIEIRLIDSGESIELNVSNPINEKTARQLVLEQFDLTSRYRKSREDSNHFGIGLHMADQVMARHHGRLETEVKPDLFTIRLVFPRSNLEV